MIINKLVSKDDLNKISYKIFVKELENLYNDLIAKNIVFYYKSHMWLRFCEYIGVILYSEVKEGQRILDVGCGGSIFSIYLAQQGCEVYTVDIRNEVTKIIADVNKGMNLNIKHSECNTCKLNFENEFFDNVFSISVIEHISLDQQMQAVKEMSRVLKKNGILALTFDYGEPMLGAKIPDAINDKRIKEIIKLSELEVIENKEFCNKIGETYGQLFLRKE